MGNGPSVEISLSTKAAQAEVRNLSTELKNQQKEFKATDAQLQNSGTKLDQMRNKYQALEKQMQTQRSITSKYKEIVQQTAQAQETAKRRLEQANRAYEEGKKQYGENSTELKKLQQEVIKCERAMNTASNQTQKFSGKLSDSVAAEERLKSQLKTTNDELQKQEKYTARVAEEFRRMQEKTALVRSGMSATGKALTAGVTVPIAAGAAFAVKSMDDVDEGLDVVMQKTGATGEAAKELDAVYRQVAGTIPGEFGDIGAAVGEINTRLEFTGDKLKAASEDFLKFAKVNGTDVNTSVQLVARAMGDAGIAADDYKLVLDQLTVAGQKSGISVDTLAQNLAKYGAPMRALGFDTEKSIALFAAWEKAGVSTEIAFSGMKKSISNFGAAGKDSAKEFEKSMDAIKKAPTQAEAISKAIDIFGTKAGPDLADAIRGGRFEVESYIEALQNAGGAVEGTYGMIVDEVDDAQLAIQKIKLAFYAVGETIAKTAGPILLDFANRIKGVVERFGALDKGTQNTILKMLALAAAVGPMLSIGSKAITVINGVGAAIKVLTTGSGLLGGAMSALTGPVGLVLGGIALVAGGTYAAIKAQEAAEKAFYNCGDAIQEATDKYTAYSDKATKTKEYTDEYRRLNTVISNGLLPAEKLAEAEEKRKQVEQWLIDNYGDVISAEEQKMGIKEDSLGVIERMTEAERKRLEVELQSEIQQNKNKMPELKQSIEDMQRQNKELEAQYISSKELANELKILQNEWQVFASGDATEEDKADELQKIVEKAQRLTGMDFGGNMANLDAYINELGNDADHANEKIEENTQKIQDGKQSIDQYNDAVRQYADIKLDGKYDEVTNSLFALVTAQNELNDKGEISNETMARVLELVPGFEDQADKPEFLAKSIENLSTKLKNAGVDVDDLIKKTDKIPRDIPINVNIVEHVTPALTGGYTYGTLDDKKGPRIYPKVDTSLQYNIGGNADGTKHAQAGPSVVNEKGPELIQHKDGTFSMAPTSPAVVPLQEGDVVYTAEETRKMMGVRTVQHFKDGTGYDQAKKEFQHRKNISNVSTDEEIAFWEQVRIQYVADDDAVIDADENLFKLRKERTKDLYDYQKELTDDYINDRTYNNDWDAFNDSPFAAYERAATRWEQDLAAGTITEKEYHDNIAKLGKDLYDQRRDNSEKWLEEQLYYGKISQDDYIAGLERQRDYTQQYYDAGLIDFQAYNGAMSDIDKSLYEERKSRAKEFFEYQKQLSEEYISDRSYNNDWDAFGDDPIVAYNRVKERWAQDLEAGTITEDEYNENLKQLGSDLYQQRRADSAAWMEDQRYYDNISTEDYIAGLERQRDYTQQYYDAGIISYREYNDAMRELDKNLYAERKAVLEQQVNDYYDAQRKELTAARKAIEDKYNLIDKEETRQERKESLEDLRRQESMYAGAATIEGKKKLEDIRKQIADLEKQQENEIREEKKAAELQEIDDQTERLEEQQQQALQGVSKYARELSGIFGKSNADLSAAFGKVLQQQDQQQRTLMDSGYTAVCNIVDNTSAKIAEFEERAARLQQSLAQLGIMSGLGMLGGAIGVLPVAAAKAAPQYTMHQQNTYYVPDTTAADMIGRKSGRAFLTMGNIDS